MHFHHFRLKKHVLPQLQTKEQKKRPQLHSHPENQMGWYLPLEGNSPFLISIATMKQPASHPKG